MQQIEALPMYKQHVNKWSESKRLLRIESRKTLHMPERLLTAFINKEARRNICKDAVKTSYVRKAFIKAFKDCTDDWIAVMSTSLNERNQKDWRLEGFLLAGLTSTYHETLDPVWELSLICTGKLSGIGLTLVQGFVYAAKVYTETYKTPPLVFLDLANGYANTAGLATYSHVGYSTLSPLLKEEPMHSIIKQRIADEDNRSEIVTDASVFMVMDLANISASILKNNIGHKSSPFFGDSVDTLLGLAAKIKKAILTTKQDLLEEKIELPVTECDETCLKKVDTAIQDAFDLAKKFYNIRDSESNANFQVDHNAFVLDLQKTVHNCTDNLTIYTNLRASSRPSSSPSVITAPSSGGGSNTDSSTNSTKSVSQASSSGGGSNTKSLSPTSSSDGTKSSSSASSSGGAFSRLRTYGSSSGAFSLGTPSHSVSSLSLHRHQGTFSPTESPTNPRGTVSPTESPTNPRGTVSPTESPTNPRGATDSTLIAVDDDDDDDDYDDAFPPASQPTMGVSAEGDLHWTTSTRTFPPIDVQSDWKSNAYVPGHGFGTAS